MMICAYKYGHERANYFEYVQSRINTASNIFIMQHYYITFFYLLKTHTKMLMHFYFKLHNLDVHIFPEFCL